MMYLAIRRIKITKLVDFLKKQKKRRTLFKRIYTLCQKKGEK